MTQTPTHLPTSTSNPIGTIFGSVGHGMWLAATSSPWLGAVFCLLILSVMARIYREIRWAPIASAGLDPLRQFGGRDRAAILSRAGVRCERHSLLFGRCTETEKLHADHVQLGATALGEAASFILSDRRQWGSRPSSNVACVRQSWLRPGWRSGYGTTKGGGDQRPVRR